MSTRKSASNSLRILRFVPCLLCAALILAPVWAQGSFVVVVQASNPVTTMKRQEVSDLFLKRKTSWADGLKATPVDLSERLPVRSVFSESVHKKATAAVKTYWQRLIFAGRDVPPPEKVSAEEVMAYVRSRRGAIGYVPTGTALGNGVKSIVLEP